MERGKVTAARGREREWCDGQEMNREEGGGRAPMASHILFWGKLALGKTRSVNLTETVVLLCNSPITSFDQWAGRTEGRGVKWGETLVSAHEGLLSWSITHRVAPRRVRSEPSSPPPASGRVIHIDQSAMESRRTEVKWTDVQRLKVTGNKEGKCLTVVWVVTQSRGGNSHAEQSIRSVCVYVCVCVCVCGYARVHECRCDAAAFECFAECQREFEKTENISSTFPKKKLFFFTLHRSHISFSVFVEKCCKLPPAITRLKAHWNNSGDLTTRLPPTQMNFPKSICISFPLECFYVNLRSSRTFTTHTLAALVSNLLHSNLLLSLNYFLNNRVTKKVSTLVIIP